MNPYRTRTPKRGPRDSHGFSKYGLRKNMPPLMRLVSTIQYQKNLVKVLTSHQIHTILDVIHQVFNPSIQYLVGMSFSTSNSSTIPTRRKHTISEHVTENGDPLAIRKKARDAAKQGASASVTSQAVPAPLGVNKPSQVSLKLSDNVNISPSPKATSAPPTAKSTVPTTIPLFKVTICELLGSLLC